MATQRLLRALLYLCGYIACQGVASPAACLPNGVFNGSAPQSAADLGRLAADGIKTIISVDGDAPDAGGARARGMRYVHLPIGYDGITEDQALKLMRAIRDLPKPIYVHCHHGKHRSPAAAARAMVGLGWLSNEEGLAFMRRSGTSEHYKGLYACVAEARPVDPALLDAVPMEFPEQQLPSALADVMLSLEGSLERLEKCKNAGWRPPTEAPDLEPLHEAEILSVLAARLTDFHGAWAGDPKFQGFAQRLATSSRRLEVALRAPRRASEVLAENRGSRDRLLSPTAALGVVHSDCRACHAVFRDK